MTYKTLGPMWMRLWFLLSVAWFGLCVYQASTIQPDYSDLGFKRDSSPSGQPSVHTDSFEPDPKIVDVPGLGTVAFPGTMSNDEIGAQIQAQLKTARVKAWHNREITVAVGLLYSWTGETGESSDQMLYSSVYSSL